MRGTGFPHSDIVGSSRLHTAPRRFSQCTTSFLGGWRPGIPRMLFLAYPMCYGDLAPLACEPRVAMHLLTCAGGFPPPSTTIAHDGARPTEACPPSHKNSPVSPGCQHILDPTVFVPIRLCHPALFVPSASCPLLPDFLLFYPTPLPPSSVVEMRGLEPRTYALQRRRSPA